MTLIVAVSALVGLPTAIIIGSEHGPAQGLLWWSIITTVMTACGAAALYFRTPQD